MFSQKNSRKSFPQNLPQKSSAKLSRKLDTLQLVTQQNSHLATLQIVHTSFFDICYFKRCRPYMFESPFLSLTEDFNNSKHLFFHCEKNEMPVTQPNSITNFNTSYLLTGQHPALLHLLPDSRDAVTLSASLASFTSFTNKHSNHQYFQTSLHKIKTSNIK